MLVTHYDLLCLVGWFPEHLPRTLALEQRIRIGAGFHGKWYTSQAEHWRGWMGFHDARLRRLGKDPALVSGNVRWRGLSCAPMMFWLAEAAGVPADRLDRAEAAAHTAADAIRHDHASHGKAMREVLPWPVLEAALGSLVPLASAAVASVEEKVAQAHRKLIQVHGKVYA